MDFRDRATRLYHRPFDGGRPVCQNGFVVRTFLTSLFSTSL